MTMDTACRPTSISTSRCALKKPFNRGIVLYFAAEFELTRSRWYWFDEQILRRSKTFRLSYHALTRQYCLSTGASSLHQSYASLDGALSVMSHVRNWQASLKRMKSSEANRLRVAFFDPDRRKRPRPFRSARWPTGTGISRPNWSGPELYAHGT